MELREYWAILVRRWQLIGVVTAIAFVVSAGMVLLGPTYYKSELRITVNVKPEPRQGEYYMYDSYYTWLTSEYLVDDFGEVMKSDAFAKDVSARLGQKVSPESIKRQTRTIRTHRILALTITTGSPALSLEIAQAMKDVMEVQAPSYFGALGNQNAMLRVIDDPTVAPEMGRARQALEIVLRTVVGIVAAVALAFLLNYIDPTVRTMAEAERQLGLPVLAEIPR